MSDIIPSEIPLKQCIRCQQAFPATLEYFPPAKGGSRLKAMCRPCTSTCYREWSEQHREVRAEYNKTWQQENKELIVASRQRRKEARKSPPPVPTCKEGEKQCTQCKGIFPATPAYFHRASRGKYGLAALCKRCKGKGRTFGKETVECGPHEKQCVRCQTILPATTAYFYQARRGKYGLTAICKRCMGKGKTFGRKRVLCGPHEKQCNQCLKIFPKSTAYFARNNDPHHDGFAAWCKQCRHELYMNQRTSILQQRRAQRQANPEHFRKLRKASSQRRQQRRRNDPHYDAYHKARSRYHAQNYRLTHPEAARARKQNRLSRERQVPGTHTAAQIQEQLKRQRYRCYYGACGFAKFQRTRQPNGTWKYDFHVDHTFPTSRIAGMEIPGNEMSYLVLACPTCNEKKGNKFPWEWIEGGRLL